MYPSIANSFLNVYSNCSKTFTQPSTLCHFPTTTTPLSVNLFSPLKLPVQNNLRMLSFKAMPNNPQLLRGVFCWQKPFQITLLWLIKSTLFPTGCLKHISNHMEQFLNTMFSHRSLHSPSNDQPSELALWKEAKEKEKSMQIYQSV